MQLYNLLALTLGLALTTDAELICSNRGIGLGKGIKDFCKQDFTVPSDYASNGIRWNVFRRGTMKVTGKCNPPQKVTKDVCIRQMTQVCSNGGPRGGGTRYFGRNGCQAWTIDPGREVTAAEWAFWFKNRKREEGELYERDQRDILEEEM